MHEAELIGKELRVIILPSEPVIKSKEDIEEGVSLAEMFKGRTGMVSFEPSDLSEQTGKKFADLLAEKYEKEQHEREQQ